MAKGALAHRLQRRAACNTSPLASMRTSKIQNGRHWAPKWQTGSRKGLGHSRQLLFNTFFDPSTPCMRKVDDGETGKILGKKTMSEIVTTDSVAWTPTNWNTNPLCIGFVQVSEIQSYKQKSLLTLDEYRTFFLVV